MVYDGWLIRRDGPRPTYTPTLRIVVWRPSWRSGRRWSGTGWRSPGTAGDDGPVRAPRRARCRSALRLVRACRTVESARDLAPANAIAAGKVLLAFRAPWSDAVLAAPLAAPDRAHPDRPGGLRADLERVRRRGYAVEDEEFAVARRALAVPVVGEAGEGGRGPGARESATACWRRCSSTTRRSRARPRGCERLAEESA